MRNSLVIIGAGGHGRVVHDAAVASDWNVIGFLDDTKEIGYKVNGVPIIGGISVIKQSSFLPESDFVIALGDQLSRRNISSQVLELGRRLAIVAHPSCIISPYAKIGNGTVLVGGCIVNANASIGSFCILNTASTIDHDGILASGVQISPGVNLAGWVYCGEDAYIGTGAAILPNVRIGARAIVGAGSVVIRDVPDDAIVAGNPARRLRPSPTRPKSQRI
jgi:acetyltransferase EpsM